MFKPSNIFFIPSTSINEDKRTSATAFLFAAVRDQWVRFSAAATIARERKALGQVSETQLRDMGITRAEADMEAQRDYFDIPAERLTLYGQLDCGAQKCKQASFHQ